MPASMTGQTAVITGGTRGIGLATARRLAADGARVFTVDMKGDVDRHADVTTPGINAQLVAEAVSFADCTTTADMEEGLGAFVAKRKPVYKGR